MDCSQIIKEANRFGLGQIHHEWLNLLKFLDTIKPEVIVEIGSNKGGSSYSLANFAKHLICVDIKDICKSKGAIRAKCNFDFIVGDSKDKNTIKIVEEKLNNQKIDFLFIDGDHSYEGVKADFENFSKLVKPGGYIAFHDIVKSSHHIGKNCLVFKLWEEIRSKYPGCIEYKSGNVWAGIGIVKV